MRGDAAAAAAWRRKGAGRYRIIKITHVHTGRGLVTRPGLRIERNCCIAPKPAACRGRVVAEVSDSLCCFLTLQQAVATAVLLCQVNSIYIYQVHLFAWWLLFCLTKCPLRGMVFCLKCVFRLYLVCPGLVICFGGEGAAFIVKRA